MRWGYYVCPFTPGHVMRWTDDLTWMDSMDYLNRIHDGEWEYVYRFYDPSPWILYSNIRREIRQGDWKL